MQGVTVAGNGEDVSTWGMGMWEKVNQILQTWGKHQEDLASILGVSPSRISKWKSVRNGPRVDEVKVIAKGLRVKASWLIDDDAPDDPMAIRPNGITLSEGERVLLAQIRKIGLEAAAEMLAAPPPSHSGDDSQSHATGGRRVGGEAARKRKQG